MKALLILIDGTVYEGVGVGAPGTATGEVVFNTSMTGYQEILTDPSYAGQLVALTYPLIGNYGVNTEDAESMGPQVSGFVVKEMCAEPSNYRSQQSGDEYLLGNNIVGIQGVDVRALVRKLRDEGVMLGMISTEHTAESGLQVLRELPAYDAGTFAREVSTERVYQWQNGQGVSAAVPGEPGDTGGPLSSPPSTSTAPGANAPSPQWEMPLDADGRVVVLDYGTKFNILRSLRDRNLEVVVLPCSASTEEIMAWQPDGIMLSNGPGDPRSLQSEVATIKEIGEREPDLPVFGICLGHQLLGQALGGETFKLKFGHRGSNHPVKDLTTGKVHITSQNHGYAIEADSLPENVQVTHLNLNDNTVEGLQHRERPAFSVQYHPEASPGPKDNAYLFDRFAEMVKARKK
jgi:carbamoyl-phosphate synthase small subunit